MSDTGEIERLISVVRAELPPGAPVVPFASVRSRDRVEARHGSVFNLGLASPRFANPNYGDFLLAPGANLYTFRGQLGFATVGFTFQKVKPGPDGFVFLVADEVDEPGILMALGLTKLAVLTPTRSGPGGIDALNREFGIRCGVLDPLTVGPEAADETVLCSRHHTVILDRGEPLGLVFLGGDDLTESRARARIAREILAQQT